MNSIDNTQINSHGLVELSLHEIDSVTGGFGFLMLPLVVVYITPTVCRPAPDNDLLA